MSAPTNAAPTVAAPGEFGRPRLVDPNSLVFWVFVAAAAFSGVHLFSEVTSVPTIQAVPAIGWLALVQWTLYGVVFFAVVNSHQLFVRRPAAIIAAALVWGGVVATWFAAEANASLESLIGRWTDAEFADRWALSLSAATNEEILKLLGVVVLALLPLVAIRSTLDGWFYGMMVGLGFQVVEDFIYTVQQSADLGDAVNFLVMRGFFAGLWAHAVYTGITGAGIGYVVARRDRPLAIRLLVALGLFAVAWSLHFLWDAEIINEWFGDSAGGFFATILVKGVPALVFMLVVLRFARNDERPKWRAFVAAHADPAVLPPADADALLDRAGRKAARRSAARSGGRTAARAVHQRQTLQLRYVQSLMERGEDDPTTQQLVAELR